MTQQADTIRSEVQVRIGEIAESIDAACVLVTVGLGSCIGVVVLDERSGAAGMAHVFLPEPPVSGGREGAGVGTYADRAVPELVERVTALAQAAQPSHARPRLVAIMAGGSKMFSGRAGADIGDRNAIAVRAALEQAGIRLVAEDVGGSRGRTLRAQCGADAAVIVREVGSAEREIWRGAIRAPAARTVTATASPTAAAA